MRFFVTHSNTTYPTTKEAPPSNYPHPFTARFSSFLAQHTATTPHHHLHMEAASMVGGGGGSLGEVCLMTFHSKYITVKCDYITQGNWYCGYINYVRESTLNGDEIAYNYGWESTSIHIAFKLLGGLHVLDNNILGLSLFVWTSVIIRPSMHWWHQKPTSVDGKFHSSGVRVGGGRIPFCSLQRKAWRGTVYIYSSFKQDFKAKSF